MRYELGNTVISVEMIDPFGRKRPGLYIGTRCPNMMWKVASFGSDDKAETFCKWFEYMVGLRKDEPGGKCNDRT